MSDEIHKSKFLINENNEIKELDKELLEINEKLLLKNKEFKTLQESKDEEIKNIIVS